MRRREAVGLLALGVFSVLARAQRPARVARVGWLEWTSQGKFSERTARAFIEGLRASGYVEGTNLAIEKRVAFGDRHKLVAQARELAGLKVDVLFTPSKAATDAAWYASRAIPTVIATVTDPVAVQYAVSLARPGKHITGVTTASAELTGKRLELLGEATGAKRIAVLYDKTLYDSCEQELKQFRGAAAKLGIALVEVPVDNLAGSLADLEPAMRRIAEARAQAIIMPLFTSVSDFAPEIARLALKYRLPTMHEVDDAESAGYLLTYGPDFADVYRRAAGYVARILKGEKPADMAIEEPRRFVFTANLKVAKALGIALPQSILLRADRVIE
ncbi:MAG: ABC transporter substrate-binding protein [Betaproteobacteria bacterium]